MTTLNDFLREHPVTVIHLYRPDPKDWYKDVMAYLSRVHRHGIEAAQQHCLLELVVGHIDVGAVLQHMLHAISAGISIAIRLR